MTQTGTGLFTGRGRHEPHPSSTGLRPPVAAALSYLAGPLSAILLLLAETSSRFVKFHAWQSLVGLGVLAVAALTFLGLAFVMLVFSSTAFWVMLWLAAIAGAAWIVLWATCLVQAWRGRLWHLPLVGHYAERRAGITS